MPPPRLAASFRIVSMPSARALVSSRLRATTFLGLALLSALALAQAAGSAAFPQRTVRIIAAQQAGSATDKVARIVADSLAGQWKQSAVVDNRPGASGGIGTQIAARAESDGYTLLVGGISSLVVNPELTPDVGFDPEADFLAIGRVAYVPFVLVVNADLPARTVAELAALARERPGRITFGNSGVNTFSASCLRAITSATGAQFLSVDYKGSASATLDLVAGRIDARVVEYEAIAPHVAAGKLRVLAIGGHRRFGMLPDVPTLAEAGVPGVDMTPWYGLLAPAGVAPAVREQLEAAYAAMMRDPRVHSRLDAIGYEAIRDEPGAFARALKQDRFAARNLMRAASLERPARP